MKWFEFRNAHYSLSPWSLSTNGNFRPEIGRKNSKDLASPTSPRSPCLAPVPVPFSYMVKTQLNNFKKLNSAIDHSEGLLRKLPIDEYKDPALRPGWTKGGYYHLPRTLCGLRTREFHGGGGDDVIMAFWEEFLGCSFSSYFRTWWQVHCRFLFVILRFCLTHAFVLFSLHFNPLLYTIKFHCRSFNRFREKGRGHFVPPSHV